MDHHCTQMSSIAFVSLQLLLIMIIVMLAAATGERSSKSDIDCLRSIKESLEDPLDMLSTWQFDNNPGKLGNFICSFRGVECWHPDSNILNIKLSGMGLKGEFPRGLANCSSLTGLNLSNNHLYGSIPRDVSTLFSYVTLIDLSSNEFSGEIPPDIANCSYLNVLMLDNNLFTGSIPAPLSRLQRLKYFSVANNHLSGPVPGFPNAAFPPEIYANNTGLCGYPLDSCESDDLFLGGFFAGWGVFFTVSLVIGLFTSFWESVIKFIKRRVTPNPGRHSSNKMDDSTTHMLEKFATRMSFLELSRATNEFDENNVVAAGEMGTTYKATVSNGSRLAIKRLIVSNAPHIEHAFRLEILVLGKLRHRNLVPLLGFCHESDHRLLVYKLTPNGSLHDRLFSSGGKAAIMEWPVRVRIAVGVANGIAWLHRNRVIHRGVSSKCILLDKNLEPKISDFGNAIAPNEAYSGWGLPLSSGQLSVVGPYEQDVHGFGTVLLELVTGIRYEEIISSFDIHGDMSEQIFRLLNVSQSSMEQEFGDEMSCLLSVAAKCVECDPGNWPSMGEVYQMLRTGTRRSFQHDTC